jgi:glycosyltransferase 2 family protein
MAWSRFTYGRAPRALFGWIAPPHKDPGSPTPAPTARSPFAVARVTLGLAILAYLAWSGAIDWSRLLGLATAWQFTTAALLLLALVVVAASWRLCLLLSAYGLHLSLGASLRLSLVGAVFNNFLPGSSGGDVVRIYLAGRMSAGSRTEIATIIILDRIIGLLALLLAPLLIAAAAPGIVRSAALGTLLLVAGVGAVFVVSGLVLSAHPNSPVRRLVIAASGRRRAGIIVARVGNALLSYRHHRRTILGTIALSLVIQGLVIAAIQFILLANAAPAPSLGAALLTPFGMLVNSLPLTPGGLGVGEAAFESLFRLAAVAGGAEAILSWRVLTTLIDTAGAVIIVAGRTDVRLLAKAAFSPSGDENAERTASA